MVENLRYGDDVSSRTFEEDYNEFINDLDILPMNKWSKTKVIKQYIISFKNRINDAGQSVVKTEKGLQKNW